MLDGKVALVTGASKDLGYDACCALAEAGASVAITSRSLEKAEKAAKRLSEQYKTKTLGYHTDRSNQAGFICIYFISCRNNKITGNYLSIAHRERGAGSTKVLRRNKINR